MMMSFFGQNIAVAGIAAVLFNTIIYLAIAYIAFGDVITAREMVGIALGLVAIVLFELG